MFPLILINLPSLFIIYNIILIERVQTEIDNEFEEAMLKFSPGPKIFDGEVYLQKLVDKIIVRYDSVLQSKFSQNYNSSNIKNCYHQ